MISILSKAATWSPEQPFGEAFSRVFSSRLCSAQLIWTAVAFHGQAVKTVVYLRVSTTQQVLGPEARTPEGIAGRLTARWQGGRNPALPRTGRFQDRHRQVWTCPVPPSTAHEHPRAQAEPLACISTRILSVPSYPEVRFKLLFLAPSRPRWWTGGRQLYPLQLNLLRWRPVLHIHRV